MVVEAGLGDAGLGEVVIEVGAADESRLASCVVSCVSSQSKSPLRTAWRGWMDHQLECFVLVNDLDAVLVVLSSRLVADCRKVAVHRGGVVWELLWDYAEREQEE